MDVFNPFDLTFTDPNHPFHVHHMEMCLGEAAAAFDDIEMPEVNRVEGASVNRDSRAENAIRHVCSLTAQQGTCRFHPRCCRRVD